MDNAQPQLPAGPTYVAHPGKQTSFLQSTVDWLFFGGARGGSKSFSLAWKAAFQPRTWTYWLGDTQVSKAEFKGYKTARAPGLKIHIDKISIDFPEYRGLIVRRTFPQLERNIKPETDKLYPVYGGVWKERDHCYVFPSGAKIYLAHCNDLNALKNFIGGNYHFIGIDEANMFPEEWVDVIMSSARSTDKDIKVFRCLTGNPGDIGHTWLKKKFVDKCNPKPDGPKVYSEAYDVWYQPMKSGKPYTEDGLTHQFIPSLVFDNPSIIENDPAYVRILKKLNPVLRSMWLEGNWDTFSGQFFSNWSPLHHIIEKEDFEYGKHFSKNTHTLYRGYDYGTHAPFVCVFAAVDQDGNVTVFDEIVETGLGPTKQAELVNKIAWDRYKLRPEDFADEIADPKSYWTKGSERDGELLSPSDYYDEQGIYLTPGNNDRKAGAALFYEALEIRELSDDGEILNIPRLRFRSNCEYLIGSIPNLPSKDNDAEDIDTKADDHGYDATRYLVMKILEGLSELILEKKGWRETTFGANLQSNELRIEDYGKDDDIITEDNSTWLSS